MSTVETTAAREAARASSRAGVSRAIVGVGRNAAILTGATLACKLGSLAVVPIILRSFSKTDYGTYSAAFAYTGLLGMITYFGLGPIVIRSIARGEASRGVVIYHCTVMRVALLALAAAALVVLGSWKHFDSRMWTLSWIAFAAMGVDTIMGAVRSSLQAEERFGVVAAVDVVRKASQWVLALAVIFVGVGIVGLAAAVVVAAIGAAAVAVYLGVKGSDFRGLRFSPSYALEMLKLSAPMGLSAAFVMALERIDIWFLDAWHGSAGVADYSAAVGFKPAFLAQAVVWAVLPLAFRLGKDDRDGLAATVRTGGRYLLIAGSAIAIVFFCGGGVLMPLLGGGQYAESVPVFRLMGLTLPFIFVSFLYMHALTAVDRQLVAALVFAVGLAVNVVLDRLLVPPMGPTGAIVSTLAAEAVMAAAGLVAVWRIVGRPLGTKDARLLAALAGAACVAAVMGALNLSDLGAAALATFAVLLLVLKAFTKDDLNLVMKSLRRQEARAEGGGQ